MTKRKFRIEALRALADVYEKYNVDLRYTSEDDGIHIRIDGKDIYNGWLDHPAQELRDEANRLERDKEKNE
jgi:hypothetical protein